jgi:uncharacterized protein (TIGR00255 family)
MLKSMTGFGAAKAESENIKVNVEVRCLNSRSLDIMFKPPGLFREIEHEIRQKVGTFLIRGKTDLRITVEYKKITGSGRINTALAEAYYAEMKALAERLGNPDANLMESLFRIPDVFKTEDEELCETDAKACFEALEQALVQVGEFRRTEGKNLEKDILYRIACIQDSLDKVPTFEKERMNRIRSRIEEHISYLKTEAVHDKSRFEEELIYYLEKIDITEEKVRLASHLKYFMEMVNGTDEDLGRKLNFLSQEIGREINTLGSKANDADLQRIVVNMKDDLEKIKEQLLNIL